MRIKMVCLEDGITSCGFRKMAAYVGEVNPDTEARYVSTDRFGRFGKYILGRPGAMGELDDDGVDELAQGLAGNDLVGFSSMTGYSELTRRIIGRLRKLDPDTFIVWGGIHPIIHPEDAVTADVDAICTGEGEFAFAELHGLLESGRDYTGVGNFWFKGNGSKTNGLSTNGLSTKGRNAHGDVIRNPFLPLMTPAEMDTLPFPQYGAATEAIYAPARASCP